MGIHSSTYRATNTASIGDDWFNVQDIYDDPSILSYAYRESAATSAIHINGFGINLPPSATVNSVEVHTKAFLSSLSGYLCIYLCSDVGATRVVYTIVADGASLRPAQYVTQTYSANTLVAKLNEKGIHNGDILDFLKNVRVRIVAGSVSSSFSVRSYIYDNYIVVNYTIPEYAITVNTGTGGTVTGGGSYESGTTATLTATPNTGYKFKQWSDGNTSNPRTVTVSANATYTAQFEKQTYTVSVSASPTAGGTVSGGGTYEHGSTATLTATPNGGYLFSYWRRGSDGLGNYSNPLSLSVTEGETYTAIFERSSNTYDGTKLSTAAYIGTKKLTIYCGTKKVLNG